MLRLRDNYDLTVAILR